MEKFDQAQAKLSELMLYFNTKDIINRNEATTRLHLINKLLIDVFGWDLNDVSCEESRNREYLDYKLSLVRPAAIVEAKREGDYFNIPMGHKRNVISIASLIRNNKGLEAAITQVGGYCQKWGIPIGIVTNGWQMVAYIANRTDAIPPLEGQALYFHNLKALEDNFLDYWNHLSKPAFEKKTIFKKLLGESLAKIPPKLSVSISKYPGVKAKTSLQVELEIISGVVLEDVIKEDDVETKFLQECYSKSGALSNYSLLSKEILSSRYKFLFDNQNQENQFPSVTNKRGLSEELIDNLSAGISKRPLLLIGDVGVGKSTFIKNLLKVEAPQEIEHSISFVVDLGSKAIFAIDIKQAILTEVKRQLKEVYDIDDEEDSFVRNCYFVELQNFKRSVRVKLLYEIVPNEAKVKEIEFLSDKIKDQFQHLKKSFEYISKSQKKQIIIFLDNCDQRSDNDQEAAFLVAQEFASSWPALVFISLRPETFHRARKSTGALSGYQTRAFVIGPPKVDDVLMRRVHFAQKITRGELELSILLGPVTFSKLDVLLESFKVSILRNRDLVEFIDNISNGNIRKAVELMKVFFSSGYIRPERIIEHQEKKDDYIVSLSEFLRAVILGDNLFYDPNSSFVSNIMDVHHSDPKEHFLKPLMLALLHQSITQGRNQGFTDIDSIYSSLQSWSFVSDQIDFAVEFCYSNGLIETSEKGNEQFQTTRGTMIRITTRGAYHVRKLLSQFAYIDAIVVDTPVFDREVSICIVETLDLEARLDRAEVFLNYLDRIWIELNIQNAPDDWMIHSKDVRTEILRLREKLR